MVATSGDRLLAADAIDALRSQLIPRALVVTPNLPEAAALIGASLARNEEEMEMQARKILALGARNVLITTEDGCVALLREDRESRSYRATAPRVEPVSTVGSGDALLGAYLAARHAGRGSRHGEPGLPCGLAASRRGATTRPAEVAATGDRRVGDPRVDRCERAVGRPG